MLEQTLDAGFTTVRDAFGLEWGFAQAIDRGLLRGPRVLFVGPFGNRSDRAGLLRAGQVSGDPAPGRWNARGGITETYS